MTLLLPELDRAFQAFNYSELDDPTLSQPIPQEALLRWVYLARKGDPEAGCLFTDALRTTLREGTFDCFQRVHGPRAIGYRDWFYLKLGHFLGMLLYVNVSLGSVRPSDTDDPWAEGIPVVGYSGPEPDMELLETAPWDKDKSVAGAGNVRTHHAPASRVQYTCNEFAENANPADYARRKISKLRGIIVIPSTESHPHRHASPALQVTGVVFVHSSNTRVASAIIQSSLKRRRGFPIRKVSISFLLNPESRSLGTAKVIM